MAEIVNHIRRVSDIMGEISTASAEQSAGMVEQIAATGSRTNNPT